jgi:hypothetical protein
MEFHEAEHAKRQDPGESVEQKPAAHGHQPITTRSPLARRRQKARSASLARRLARAGATRPRPCLTPRLGAMPGSKAAT